jgi:CBS domain-containing protein
MAAAGLAAAVEAGARPREAHMAATVGEVMNRALFSVRPQEPAEAVLRSILELGITAAPVLDADGRPLGVLSLRDLATPAPGRTAGDRMSSPAVVVPAAAHIPDAARLSGQTGHRHLVVVDEAGRAVGMVSAVDLIRGLLGLPARHPAALSHLDVRTGLEWTDDTRLDAAAADAAPERPGVLVLVFSRAGVRDAVVWAEAVRSVRARLLDILELPQDDPALRRVVGFRGQLFCRWAAVDDTETRERVASGLREGTRHPAPPHAPS